MIGYIRLSYAMIGYIIRLGWVRLGIVRLGNKMRFKNRLAAIELALQ